MKPLLSLITLFVLFSCSPSKNEEASFTWLEGEWKGMETDSSYFFENWKATETGWDGVGGMVMNDDTVFFEAIAIIKKENDFYYHVVGEGNEAPVDFKYLGIIKDTAVFENRTHDFPQRIVYYFKEQGKLFAMVDGQLDGKYQKQEFPLRSAK